MSTKIFSFNDLSNAQSFANESHVIVIGDNGKYWVVTPAAAEQLQQQGYLVA